MTRTQKKSPLNREFYARNVKTVARNLLGKRIVSTVGGKITSGIVVETEAYLASGDSACHGARGLTPGNKVMFAGPGLAYIYPIHARVCFNVVTGKPGLPSAVLIRAIEVQQGVDQMFRRRNVDRQLDLARGPARMCEALGIDRQFNGIDLTIGEHIWLDEFCSQNVSPSAIKQTIRIGVTSAKELKLRYVVAGNRYASGPARMR